MKALDGNIVATKSRIEYKINKKISKLFGPNLLFILPNFEAWF